MVGQWQGDASFLPRGQAAVRPCEHSVHPAQLKSSSEPPKEIAARRVVPADLAVQLELVVVHLRYEGRGSNTNQSRVIIAVRGRLRRLWVGPEAIRGRLIDIRGQKCA